MPLFLLEYPASARTREGLRPLFEQVAGAIRRSGGEFIEAQVPTDLERAYIVVEHRDEAAVQAALERGGAPPRGMAQVRLVGATLDEVKAARGQAEYLVEWDFPAGLTMEAYLERKKAKAPLYAQVPQVRFLRTYVCEDMSKCLCLYQAPDEAWVRRAREVVSTPISRLSRLAPAAEPAPAGAGHD
jgi:hypothetical protein